MAPLSYMDKVKLIDFLIGHHIYGDFRHRICVQAERRAAISHHAADEILPNREHDVVVETTAAFVFMKNCLHNPDFCNESFSSTINRTILSAVAPFVTPPTFFLQSS